MTAMISETNLPDGTPVFCLQAKEVPVLYDQIQDYLKYGIEIHQGDTIFDVGANIGLFSLWIYQKCFQEANIYAFEPIPAVFEVLQANANRVAPERIKVFPYGLANESKTVEFAYHPHATMLSTAYRDDLPELQAQLKETMVRNIASAPPVVSWLRWLPPCFRSWLIQGELDRAFQTKLVSCRLRTISEIIQEQKILRIDLLKVDVEKGELDVLLGIEPKDWHKIKQVVVEVHDLDRRLARISALLQECGFTQIKVAQEPILKDSNLFNIYAWRG